MTGAPHHAGASHQTSASHQTDASTGRGLRFCFITTFYPPCNFGGDGIDTERMATALARRDHEVTVVHDVDAYEWLAGRKVSPQPAVRDGVEVIGLRSRLRVLSPLLTHQLGRPVVHGRAIEALMRARAFDVVVFGNVSLVGGPGVLAAGGRALKVYIAHEHWLVCPTHVLWRFTNEPCDERSCTRCVLSHGRPPQFWRYTGAIDRRAADVDLFIARSEFSRHKHRAFGFTRPMEVLPYFVPRTAVRDRDRPGSPRPHDRPYFLCVGRLVAGKGLETAIQACASYPDADLLIAGSGEQEATLRALAAGARNVVFLGHVPNQSLNRYYEHAIAAIVPSTGYETFGIVLIEAFSRGAPAIARRLGPLPEIVEEAQGGLLFSTGDELLDAMRRLQTDPGCRDRLGANAARACRALWSEDVVVDRFLDLVVRRLGSRSERRVAVPRAQAVS